jgi:hypothetical protein
MEETEEMQGAEMALMEGMGVTVGRMELMGEMVETVVAALTHQGEMAGMGGMDKMAAQMVVTAGMGVAETILPAGTVEMAATKLDKTEIM